MAGCVDGSGPTTSSTSWLRPCVGPCGRRGSDVAPGAVLPGSMYVTNGPLVVGVKMLISRPSFSCGQKVRCTRRYLILPSCNNCELTSLPFTFPGAGGA